MAQLSSRRSLGNLYCQVDLLKRPPRLRHKQLPCHGELDDLVRAPEELYAEQRLQAAERLSPAPAPGYRPESLEVLFGATAR